MSAIGAAAKVKSHSFQKIVEMRPKYSDTCFGAVGIGSTKKFPARAALRAHFRGAGGKSTENVTARSVGLSGRVDSLSPAAAVAPANQPGSHFDTDSPGFAGDAKLFYKFP